MWHFTWPIFWLWSCHHHTINATTAAHRMAQPTNGFLLTRVGLVRSGRWWRRCVQSMRSSHLADSVVCTGLISRRVLISRPDAPWLFWPCRSRGADDTSGSHLIIPVSSSCDLSQSVCLHVSLTDGHLSLNRDPWTIILSCVIKLRKDSCTVTSVSVVIRCYLDHLCFPILFSYYFSTSLIVIGFVLAVIHYIISHSIIVVICRLSLNGLLEIDN